MSVEALTRPAVPCLLGAAEERLLARIEDIPEGTRNAVLGLTCPAFPTKPFVTGAPLSARRVAIVTSAALHRRDTPPFPVGSPEMRLLPEGVPASELVMSHVSINFDRAGWQRDINTIYPVERLHELVATGIVGAVAPSNYALMGSTDPAPKEATAAQIVGQLQQERSDAVLLSPV